MKEHRIIFKHVHNRGRHKDQKPDKAPRLNERICPYCGGSGINNDYRLSTISGTPPRCGICGGRGRIPI